MNEQDRDTQYEHVERARQLCLELNDIITLVNSSHDTDEILREVVEESSRALGSESARITMREGDNWVIRYVWNLPADLLGRSFTDEDLPHAALAMTTRKPVAIEDAFHDSRVNTEIMKSLGIRSVMVLPLMEKEVVTGMLSYIYHTREVSFSDAEIDYAERMATGVALALQDARLYQDLQESKKLGDALNEIDNILYSTQDYDAIMNKMLQLSTDVIGAETGVIFSKEGDRWRVRYEYKLPVSLLGQSFSNTEVMHTAITAETKRSFVAQDVLNNPDIDQKFVKILGIRSLLDFPLIIKGEVIGDLTYHYHSSPVPFNVRQVEFARKLQISISLGLENARLLDTSQQSESKLKEAEKLGKFGYFDYNVATRKLTWSEGLFQIFGRDPVLGEPTLEDFFEFYSVDPGLEGMQEMVGKKELSEFDAKIHTRDNLACIFHFSIRSVNDNDGNCAAFFGTIQDISEQKRGEDALRESEERYRALFRDSPAMIATVDTDWKMLSVNPTCANQLGYTIDELEGQSILKLFREIDHPAVIEQLQRCLQNPHQLNRWQFRKIRKDGGLLWVEEIAQAIYGPNDALIIQVVCQDVSERKLVEEERERLLLQLESVLENISEGVVIADANGNVLTMNKAALALHEYELIEQVRRPLSEYQDTFEKFDLEGRPTPFEEWPMERVLRGEQFDDYEVRVRNSTTGKSWVASYSGTSVRSKSGDIILTVITIRDISERKFAEEEIGRLNEGLKAWAAELDAANKDLEAFNYTVAHDLRNPLNIIFMSCQVIQELYGERLPGECLEYIQDIYDSVNRMNRLIDALLNFSRMGQVVPNREQVYLCKLAKDVANMLKKSDPERQVDFRITDGITADADANLMRVVLDNLIGNAWKYTGMRDKAVIEFGTTEIEGSRVYFVRDNGAGFEKAAADKLFIPFQRLPGAEEFKGSGIGLATVERIINRHGGKIWAEGEPGKGATFFFNLSSS